MNRVFQNYSSGGKWCHTTTFHDCIYISRDLGRDFVISLIVGNFIYSFCFFLRKASLSALPGLFHTYTLNLPEKTKKTVKLRLNCHSTLFTRADQWRKFNLLHCRTQQMDVGFTYI